MAISGLDAMRYLGADPRLPADDVERTVMRLVNARIVKELEKLNG